MGRHQEGAWGGGGIRLEWTRQIDNTRFRSARNNAGACFEGWVRGGPAGVLRGPGMGPGGCTVWLLRVLDRDRHAAWHVPVARTGARADRGDEVAGG